MFLDKINSEILETQKKTYNKNFIEKNIVLNGFKDFLPFLVKAGKKKISMKLLKKALFLSALNNKIDFWNIVSKCMTQNTPYVNVLELKSKKSRKVNYKVVPITKKTQKSLKYSWLTSPLKSKSNTNFSETFYKELLKIAENQGDSSKKRDELHKLAAKHGWLLNTSKK